MAKVARRESLKPVERRDSDGLVLQHHLGASTSSMYKPYGDISHCPKLAPKQRRLTDNLM